ncbi:MAG TPA: GNAT family N-acetyltransferase [Gemmatimonadaceae bacterium]
MRPTLETPRLILRPLVLSDAPEVQRLAGAREIADTTLTIPHPYRDGMAEQWIETHDAQFAEGKMVTCGATERGGGALTGVISLVLEREHARAELGYWIGTPYWGRGYATEGARAMLRYAFSELGLSRVYACHFSRNPASGKVMRKIGMKYEGCLRSHVRKWDRLEDIEVYGVLAGEWSGG